VASIFNVSSPLIEGSQDTNGCMKICFPIQLLSCRNAESDSDVFYHRLNS
jgi:hypothetical protein